MFNPTSIASDTTKLYSYLPQFVKDNDAAGGYQFLAWLNGWITEGSDQGTLTYTYSYDNGVVLELPIPLTVNNNPIQSAAGLQAIDDIIRDSPYNPGYSILLDIYRCPTYALPWFGQFVGVRFTTQQLLSDSAQRQAILAENSFARGTAATILAVANSFMLPGFTAILMERTAFIGSAFVNDPYAITITYPLDGVNALTYAQLFAENVNYAAVESNYATYGAMAGNQANLENGVLAAVPAGLFVYFNGI